ncbi:MAG TPA: outer membrane beta-barrel protein [Caulobacteraceae bacterium]|nr:outer membrane beta-barrel protein [Caulobacteraceae bacterium]
MITRVRALLCAASSALSLAAVSSALADPLGTPAMTPPLSANPNPVSADGGPLGKIYVTGAFTGLGMVQTDPVPGDHDAIGDASNAQVFIQTTSGPVQFFVEAGGYSFPILGTPYTHFGPTTVNTYSAVPVAFVKFQPTAEVSIQVGKLPTLIGAEYAFTFQNMNIERGLLWNQEPVVSDGVQVNFTKGKVTASASLNDGFYSGRYNWLSGLFTYALSTKDSFTVAGGGSLSSYDRSSPTTPLLQNNGAILNLIWTHTEGPWVVTPYFQYTRAYRVMAGGVQYAGADTWSGAVLAKYNFNSQFSLAGRVEYLASTSSSCPPDTETCAQSNLLYGPGSRALSLTLTPTWQKGVFFVRAEGSYVDVMDAADGAAFGATGNTHSQFRAAVETGILF